MDKHLLDARNVLYTVCAVFCVALFLWYPYYHWKRRHLYYYASKRAGPPTLPFVGNGLYFLVSSKDFLYKVLSLVDLYKSPSRIWLGQKLVFAIYEPKDVETILNSPHALSKPDLYKYLEPFTGTGLMSAPVPKWKRHKKIIMPTFNKKNLDNFVPAFVKQSNILLEQLEQELQKDSFDIFEYMGRCTLDIICETIISTSVQSQMKKISYFEWGYTAMEIIYKRMFFFLYHFDFIFNLTADAKELSNAVTNIHNFTRAIINQKREAFRQNLQEHRMDAIEDPKNRVSLLDLLLELSEEGITFTDEELCEEIDTFILTGSETTATVMSFVLVLLGMHTEIQEKVYQEVLDVLGPDRAVQPYDLNKLLYLDRVIRESLRILPAGPVILRGITENIQLEKCTIPAGSTAAILLISLHHDDKTWPEPLKFDPDRFLPENIAKRHPYSFIPFSGGPRNCPGLNYANMEMKTVLATLVRKFKFSSSYKNIEDIKLRIGIISKPIDGHKVSIKIRN